MELFSDTDGYAQWVTGDSSKLPILIDDKEKFDFVFSCPPYHDLEVYSEDPSDLSNMDYSFRMNSTLSR